MKKEVGVWVFAFLTFLGALHSFDAYRSLVSGEASELLQLYPFGRLLAGIDTAMYFWGSVSLAFVSMGITSLIACHNPIMALYNKILAEIEFAEGEASKVAESESSLLEMINHSLTSNSIDLRTVKERLKSVKESQNGLRVELSILTSKLNELDNSLRAGLLRLDTDLPKEKKCPFCGKSVLPQVKQCPYCGQKLPYAPMQLERL